MKKFARKCDVTGRGMNEGWVWLDGGFYTSTKEATIQELRSDIESGGLDFNEIDPKKLSKLSDEDLLEYAYDNDVLYYTTWDESDIDEYYYDEEGNEYKA